MKLRSMVIILAGFLLVCLGWNSVEAGTREVAKVEAATEVMTELMAIPEKGIAPSLLHNAYGVAAIPAVVKASFVVGGRYGWGVLVVREKEGGWSNPCFVSLTGGSVGFQIGVQSTDVILVFKSRKSIDGIITGKFTLGVDAAIAAGAMGRQAEAATDLQLKAEIYSYSRSRGLFAGVALEGAALQIDHKSNVAFYGKEGITPTDIFTNSDTEVPAAANEFKQVLGKYTAATTE
ncbi:MAG TPA: lipid-binding SYLF domain-containing protein [Desulfatiglandales bacterium]|nr:lipid-binding SYLF domain-containing protein [Desulfatiglandales bacterium]